MHLFSCVSLRKTHIVIVHSTATAQVAVSRAKPTLRQLAGSAQAAALLVAGAWEGLCCRPIK